MVMQATSARTWLAALALGALAFELLGRGAPAAMVPPLSRPGPHAGNESHADASDVDEPAAPARLLERVVELEAASGELAAKLARARHELSDP